MTLISPGYCTLQCGRWLSDGVPWNSPKRPPYWNPTSGFDFDHITAVSLQNFIQIGPPLGEKMTSRRFSRWRISAILDIRGPIMGFLISPCTTSYRSSIDTITLNCLVFLENRVYAFWSQDPRWRIFAILDFRRIIMGSLKSPCTTSYRSSIDTTALNCLVFLENRVLHFGDRQTNRQTDKQAN